MTYKIIMQKNDFFKIHNRIAVKDLEIKEEQVSFVVELGSLNILKDSGYPYKLLDSTRIKIKDFFKKYHWILLGILLLFSILYINSFRVTDIVFNTITPINSTIEKRIQSRYKKLFCFNFSNIDYKKFSENLRLEYVEYPYIEVYSKNNKILVDIYSYDDEYPLKEDTCIPGNIIAKKDGVIESFYSYAGNTLVKKNMYVKKNAILISGELGQAHLPAKGLILAYTYEKVNISIPKKESVEVATKENQAYYNISFFSKSFSLKKKNEYSLKESKEKIVFNFFDIFVVKKIEETKKDVIIKENKEPQAIQSVQNKIEENFNLNKTNSLEEIVDMKVYFIEEDSEKYMITMIVKKLESIGEFQAF